MRVWRERRAPQNLVVAKLLFCYDIEFASRHAPHTLVSRCSVRLFHPVGRASRKTWLYNSMKKPKTVAHDTSDGVSEDETRADCVS